MQLNAVDIDFLRIGELSYSFNKSYRNDDSLSCEIALRCAQNALELAVKYKVLNQDYDEMKNYLIQRTSPVEASAYFLDFTKSALATSNLEELLNKSRTKDELLDNLKALVIRYIIEGRYMEAHEVVHRDYDTLHFLSINRDLDKLNENKFFEFMFYRYAASLYHLVWFPTIDDSDLVNESGDSSSLHILDSIISKVDLYYKKNTSTLETSEVLKEVHYYWLIKWLLLFVQLKFCEFNAYLKNFNDFAYDEESGSIALLVLNTSGRDMKCKILISLKVSLMITQPFKNLSLLNYPCEKEEERELQFEFFDVEDLLEQEFHKLLIPLIESEFSLFKESFKKSSTSARIILSMGYIFPNEAHTFMRQLMLMMDFKVFLMILSSSRKISRQRMLSIIGFEEDSSFKDLLLLISILNLGQHGIGFDVEKDLFYTSKESSVALEENIESLHNKIRGDAVATFVKSSLFAQVLSSR